MKSETKPTPKQEQHLTLNNDKAVQELYNEADRELLDQQEEVLPKSRPYVFVIQNTTDLLQKIKLLGNIHMMPKHKEGVLLQCGVPGVTYQESVGQFAASPFIAGQIYLTVLCGDFENVRRYVSTLKVVYKDADGSRADTPVTLTIDPYQSQAQILMVDEEFPVTAKTIIKFKLPPQSAIQIMIYPVMDHVTGQRYALLGDRRLVVHTQGADKIICQEMTMKILHEDENEAFVHITRFGNTAKGENINDLNIYEGTLRKIDRRSSRNITKEFNPPDRPDWATLADIVKKKSQLKETANKAKVEKKKVVKSKSMAKKTIAPNPKLKNSLAKVTKPIRRK